VKQDLQEKLRPPVYGSNNVRSPNFIAQEQITFRSGPYRFEAGTYNLLGQVGLNAAMELLLEIGIDNIAAELLRKRTLLVPALQAKGYQVLAAKAGPENASSIVTFYHGDETVIPALHAKLEAANIITSLRLDRAGRRYIRLSPHFYNTDAELNHLLENL
jgi:cysteine desulfurase/selenocysteine lyase